MYLTVALGAFLASFFCFFIPESESLQKSFIDSSFWVGMCFLLFASTAVWAAFLQIRKRVLVIKKGISEISVESTVLEGYLKQYWKRVFPGGSVTQQIRVEKEKILIEITFPAVALSDQSTVVRQMEKDIKDIFYSLIGYEGTIELIYEFSKK